MAPTLSVRSQLSLLPEKSKLQRPFHGSEDCTALGSPQEMPLAEFYSDSAAMHEKFVFCFPSDSFFSFPVYMSKPRWMSRKWGTKKCAFLYVGAFQGMSYFQASRLYLVSNLWKNIAVFSLPMTCFSFKQFLNSTSPFFTDIIRKWRN